MASCAQIVISVLGIALVLSIPGPAAARCGGKWTRLLHVVQGIDDSGRLNHSAGMVNTGERTAKAYRFRIRLERGYKKCKRGDPRGKVDKIVALLEDKKVAELTDFGNCWQKMTVNLPDGVEPHDKNFLIQAKGTKGGVVHAWFEAFPRHGHEMTEATAKAIPRIRKGYEFEVLPRTKVIVGAMGKVSKKIGPFDIPTFDTVKNQYRLVTHIPAAYGKDCDASKKLRPHKVTQVKIWLNGKLEGITEVVNECPMTFKGGFTRKVKAMRNVLKVEAKGKAGGWFEVSLQAKAK